MFSKFSLHFVLDICFDFWLESQNSRRPQFLICSGRRRLNLDLLWQRFHFPVRDRLLILSEHRLAPGSNKRQWSRILWPAVFYYLNCRALVPVADFSIFESFMCHFVFASRKSPNMFIKFALVVVKKLVEWERVKSSESLHVIHNLTRLSTLNWKLYGSAKHPDQYGGAKHSICIFVEWGLWCLTGCLSAIQMNL